MKTSWKSLNFQECLEKVKYTHKVQRNEFLSSGSYPIISQETAFINGYWNNADDLFRIKKPVIVFGDHTRGLKYVNFDFVLGADGVKILQTIDEISPKFFYYFLNSIEFSNLGYARHYRLLKEITVHYPDLHEQQRIEALLDEAIAAINKINDNVEKNLQNTRQLYESYLTSMFVNQGADWENKKLKDVCKFEYGKPLPNEFRNPNGIYPVYGANGEKNRANRFYYDKKSIIVGRKGSAGEITLTEEKFWPLDVTYFITFDESKYDLIFLYHLLCSANLQKLAKGVKPGLNRNEAYSINVRIPSLPEQKLIVDKLDRITKEANKLEAVYIQKQKELDDLKKSIIKNAFSGEL